MWSLGRTVSESVEALDAGQTTRPAVDRTLVEGPGAGRECETRPAVPGVVSEVGVAGAGLDGRREVAG